MTHVFFFVGERGVGEGWVGLDLRWRCGCGWWEMFYNQYILFTIRIPLRFSQVARARGIRLGVNRM